jgi:hypothetical protein
MSTEKRRQLKCRQVECRQLKCRQAECRQLKMSTTTNIEFSIIIKDSNTAERDTALMRSVALLTLILTPHTLYG